jgi:Notch-like protein
VCSSDGSDTCLCDTNWFGTDCNTSACDYGTGPCLNGGTCHRGQGSNFTCDCMTGYGGTLCQSNIGYTPITLCNSTITKDCNNQQEKGTCVIDYYSQNATCICADGISGDNCDTIDNHCLFYKCPNGGTCVPLIDQPAKFKCLCPPGYDPLAQCNELYRRYNVCETHRPCENGGKCIIPSPFDINGTYYTCQCPPGKIFEFDST